MHFRILSIFLKFRQANKPLVKFSCIVHSVNNYNVGVYKGNELSAGCDVIIETSKFHNSRLAKDFEMRFFRLSSFSEIYHLSQKHFFRFFHDSSPLSGKYSILFPAQHNFISRLSHLNKKSAFSFYNVREK